MSKNKNNPPTDIINNVRLCDSCKNCVLLNKKTQTVKTEHFSGEEYDWKSFDEPVCKILAVQLNNVSKCDKYKENKIKVVN